MDESGRGWMQSTREREREKEQWHTIVKRTVKLRSRGRRSRRDATFSTIRQKIFSNARLLRDSRSGSPGIY